MEEMFANCKVGDLHLVKSKLNQTSYHNILQSLNFVLIQDNDPKHTSKVCQRYIKSKEEQCVIQAADLNPIELVWDELERKVKA